MNSCVLRVLGDELEPDEVIKELTIEPFAVFRRGEISSGRKRASTTGGITFDIGNGSFNRQIELAIAFLRCHRVELRSVPAISTVQEFFLDFSLDCRLDDSKTVVQRDYLPIDLILLAAETGLGICITLAKQITTSDNKNES